MSTSPSRSTGCCRGSGCRWPARRDAELRREEENKGFLWRDFASLRHCVDAFVMSTRSQTLLESLQRQFPNAKRQTLKEMVQQRRVLVNDVPATKLSQSIAAADV